MWEGGLGRRRAELFVPRSTNFVSIERSGSNEKEEGEKKSRDEGRRPRPAA